MNGALNKTVIAFGCTILLLCVAVGVYAEQPLLFLAPVALLASLLFLQHPRLLFYALIVCIPWSAEVQFTPSLGTDLPDEPLMLLTAFAAVVLWLSQWRQKEKGWRFHPLLVVLFLGFCWTAVTVLASTFPLYSVKFLLAKGWYLLAFVAMPLLLKGDEKLVRNTALLLTASMLAVTVVGLYRHAWWGFSFVGVNDVLQPFFHNHVNYSALLVMTVPLQISFLQHTKNKAWRRGLFVSLAVTLAALYLSYSRGAWLALAAGLFAFWLIKKGWLFKGFLLFTALALAAVAWLRYQDNYLQFAPDHNVTIFHQNFSEHLAATYQGRDVSTAERFYRWVAGVRMVAEKPVEGFGPTTFFHNYPAYTVPAFRTWVSNNPERSTVHNYFLLLLIEQGIPGLFFFLLLLGLLFRQAQAIYSRATDPFWKTTVAAVGSILLMQCTVNFLSDLIETDKVGSVFYLCVAVLIIASRITRIEPRITRIKPRMTGI